MRWRPVRATGLGSGGLHTGRPVGLAPRHALRVPYEKALVLIAPAEEGRARTQRGRRGRAYYHPCRYKRERCEESSMATCLHPCPLPPLTCSRLYGFSHIFSAPSHVGHLVGASQSGGCIQIALQGWHFQHAAKCLFSQALSAAHLARALAYSPAAFRGHSHRTMFRLPQRHARSRIVRPLKTRGLSPGSGLAARVRLLPIGPVIIPPDMPPQSKHAHKPLSLRHVENMNRCAQPCL
jgi:hypothetical protein